MQIKRTGSKQLILVVAVSLLLWGCEAVKVVTDISTSIAVSQGAISDDQAESIRKSSAAVSKAFTDVTPEQEYYIGRAVGASIVGQYKPYTDVAATRYLNLLGQSIARASDLPVTYGGYHFLILDSDEVNAFAAPGGLIFITRGMLRCCQDEDALAAVVAHEIAHVQARHGLQAIKKSRITEALTIIGAESAKQFGDADLAKLTETFEASIRDVTTTLVNRGYSRAFEYEADQIAGELLQRLGYDPAALSIMLTEMQQRLVGDQRGFARTHPAPSDRIVRLVHLSGLPADAPPAARWQRFSQNMAGI